MILSPYSYPYMGNLLGFKQKLGLMYCTTIETSGRGHEICIGIHMISTAIWGKSAQLNYTKTNPICGL